MSLPRNPPWPKPDPKPDPRSDPKPDQFKSVAIRSSPMSKISPCLWFNGEAEEAANLYVSLLPDSRIETVQRNTMDQAGAKAGSALVVEFTLAGQRFMALNGGMKMEYTHADSFKIDCADQ